MHLCFPQRSRFCKPFLFRFSSVLFAPPPPRSKILPLTSSQILFPTTALPPAKAQGKAYFIVWPRPLFIFGYAGLLARGGLPGTAGEAGRGRGAQFPTTVSGGGAPPSFLNTRCPPFAQAAPPPPSRTHRGGCLGLSHATKELPAQGRGRVYIYVWLQSVFGTPSRS